MNKRTLALSLAALIPLAAPGQDRLKEGFLNPPEETKPWCYWYWISDNISREGITRDLEAMWRGGISDVFIGETIADKPERGALPYIPVDPPTIQMEFAVNDGPLAGQDGRLVTARHIWERLVRETRINVALRVRQTADPKVFEVEGRGEMQIAILVEQMRREGYEVLVSRPEVLWKKGPNGELLEPIEKLFLEVRRENPR